MTSGHPSAVATGLVERARRSPDQRAAWDLARTLTFGELDALAASLAADLLEHTVQQPDGALLPLLVRRNVESIVAIHAAIRGGLAFAPIDATIPPAALAELLHRLGGPTVAVVTRQEDAARLPLGMGAVIVPRDPRTGVTPQSVEPGDRALALFTSGSTGQPKAVVVDWCALDDIPRSVAELDPHAASLSAAPFTFIAGLLRVLELPGGPALSVADLAAQDPRDLLERIDREGLTTVAFVPSFIATLTERWPAGRRLESARLAITFGEPLHWEQVTRLRALVSPDAVVRSKYGASESLGEALRFDVQPEDDVGTGPVPLGWPVPTSRARLAPIDASEPHGPTQIVLMGRLASGYLDDPEATATTFGRDPDGARWWLSGDVATQTEDGCYHRVGRIDDFVKIRGRLVEPSQPQHALQRIPGVRSAVVLPQPAMDGTAALVAHLELDDNATLTPEDVRGSLASALPSYLVPSLLVRHERLPLTASGKVDRQRLLSAPPEPWRSATRRKARTESERFAAMTAAYILGRADVGPDDDLWELGLDSLAAVELVGRLADAGWPAQEPTVLLEHRTPAALARLQGEPHRTGPLVRLEPRGDAAPLFCIPGAGGTALAFPWLAEHLGARHPCVVIEAHGLHGPGRMDSTVGSAAERVARAVEAEQPAGPVVLVAHSAGGAVAYEAAHRLVQRSRSVRLLLLDPVLGGPDSTDGDHLKVASRTMRRRALRLWLRVMPARTVPAERRYRAFLEIGARAIRSYRPPHATFPVVVFPVEGWTGSATLNALADDVTVIPVGGDHRTMLEPPHVIGLAREIRAVLRP